MVRNANWAEKTLVGLAVATAFVLVLQYSTPVVEWDVGSTLESSKKEFLGLPTAATKTPSSSSSASSSSTSSTSSAASSSLPAYHIVFSTSCTPQQNWESLVFFYHAMKGTKLL
jgi:hypothetical protein